MANRLPADKRRAQILEAALTIAAEQGVAALTMRPLAEAAGVSLGVLHYHFDDNDTLLTHLGETQILQVNDGMRLVFGQYTQPGLTGIRRWRTFCVPEFADCGRSSKQHPTISC
jgi:AcrR family transcriptional regulator